MGRRLLGSVVIALLAGCARGPAPQSAPVGPPVVVGDQGTAFHVWAPHASAAWVEGDFNGWSASASPLSSDGDGTFSGLIPGVHPGSQYRYVLRSGGTTLVRNDPAALQVLPDLSASVVYDPSAFAWSDVSWQPPPFEKQVIYELHLATFVDSSGNGAGGFASAATRLDYLASLGINMVEVLPPAQFQGAYSWGYNPAFPAAAESRYGSPDDLKTFVQAAHARGIGVIVDVVHNHWGPQGLPMWCFDGPCFGAGNGGIYFYTAPLIDTGFGPRPDFATPEVRDYIVGNAMMWLRDYHCDGLRWDSVVNIRRAGSTDLPDGWSLLRRINDTVHAGAPGKIQIAEDLQGYGAITSPTAQGGAGFDSQWDPAFFYPMKTALTAVNDADRDMNAVAAAISHRFNGTATERVVFTENHDQVAPQNGPTNLRIPVLVDSSAPGGYYAQKRTMLGIGVTLTSPGVPMLFMGQEFLESLPFPFGPAQALDWSKATTFHGLTRLVHRLIYLRENGESDTRGLTGNGTQVFHVNDAAKVLAWHRWDHGGPGDDVVVLANFSAVAFPSYVIGFPAGGTWQVRFNGDWNGYSPLFNNTPSNAVQAVATPRDGQGYSGSVGVGPYSLVILSQ